MSDSKNSSPLIDLRQSIRNPVGRSLYRMVGSPLERLLAVRQINEAYERYASGEIPRSENFFLDTLRYLKVNFEISDEDLARIPTDRPILVVANHPMGGLDGVVLGAILTQVRSDARVLANSLLYQIPDIRPWLIKVNPFGGKDAQKQNLRGLKQVISHLKGGGCVGTFPSGTVSHLHLRQRQVTDPQWNNNTARFVRLAQCTVVPVYFDGKNSTAFQLLGLLHPMLRTVMLPREFVRKSNQTIKVSVGKPISWRRMEQFESDEKLTDFLRLSTYILKNRDDKGHKKRRFPIPFNRGEKEHQAPPSQETLADPIAPEKLRADVEAIPADRLIFQSDQMKVFLAKAEHIPNILQEIGRLREETFREVGEGCGKSRDLDRFDQYYHHLFMWDDAESAIVGAYRIGFTDEILEKHGVDGLYTSTLFRFKPEAMAYFNPGMELGRSFIAIRYQRKHSSLVLMWRAIMRISARWPRYHVLFGPVSITREYQALSKDLMVQFLKNKNYDSDLAALVKPRNPPPRARLKAAEKQALKESLRDIDDVSALIAEIETDRKGVPTLLRHYLKLKGQMLSFNVDPDFGECLDGLIMVDFTRGNFRLIRQYMGNDGWKRFAAHHDLPEIPE